MLEPLDGAITYGYRQYTNQKTGIILCASFRCKRKHILNTETILCVTKIFILSSFQIIQSRAYSR